VYVNEEKHGKRRKENRDRRKRNVGEQTKNKQIGGEGRDIRRQ